MRNVFAYASACTLCAIAAGAAVADYPTKPIRVIVPYSAGGSTDTVARIVVPRLSQRLGQQVVIDNRTGAGTLIGTEIAVRSTPDGYTILMATPPLAVNPGLYPKVPYVLERDFTAVGNIASSTNLLTVHPLVPANSTSELIALLKKNPASTTTARAGLAERGTSRPRSSKAWRASTPCTCRTKAARLRWWTSSAGVCRS